ncbi:hypothetical protein GJ744_007909 [Endocarpon pusillum]|uniref:Uncharacterized protein n=1 Tax=Endocarpon pusillum TaxID=364733 RepID=A0A8H7ALD4_9EURO|nr:hypothetical protein GJ744_007909 [Endocarpon pusillum]
MLHVADVTHSNADLHRLQRTTVIDFLKSQKLRTDTDQRQEVDPKDACVAGAYTRHMRHRYQDLDGRSTIWKKQEICLGIHSKGEGDLSSVCYELDAVETQIRREEWFDAVENEECGTQSHDIDLSPEKGKKSQRKQDQILSQLALAAFHHLQVADQIFQTNDLGSEETQRLRRRAESSRGSAQAGTEIGARHPT